MKVTLGKETFFTGGDDMSSQIVWQPQAKQAAFMARPEWEALYGGAAG